MPFTPLHTTPVRRLLLFNPDNDLALANGDANFQPPASALRLARDLRTLPLWWGEPDATLLIYADPVPKDAICEPWGWSAAARARFLRAGVSAASLPSPEAIARLRELSHRRTGILLLEALRRGYPHLNRLPEDPQLLTSTAEAESYIAARPDGVVLKAPWSSSGKGILWSRSLNNPSARISTIIRKMGGILAEPHYRRIADFAMLFRSDASAAEPDGRVAFAGYSLFTTDELGAYHGNLLLSDEAIEARLSQYAPLSYFADLRAALCRELSKLVGEAYSGFLGVDMMVIAVADADGIEQYLVHPCVELNLRMTMGMVARIFADRYMAPGASGTFAVLHAAPGELLRRYPERESADAEWADGRLRRGRVCLTPVYGDTEYTVVVECRGDGLQRESPVSPMPAL